MSKLWWYHQQWWRKTAFNGQKPQAVSKWQSGRERETWEREKKMSTTLFGIHVQKELLPFTSRKKDWHKQKQMANEGQHNTNDERESKMSQVPSSEVIAWGRLKANLAEQRYKILDGRQYNHGSVLSFNSSSWMSPCKFQGGVWRLSVAVCQPNVCRRRPRQEQPQPPQSAANGAGVRGGGRTLHSATSLNDELTYDCYQRAETPP